MESLKYHKRALKIAKEVKDKVGEGMSYCGLGKNFFSLGDTRKAINYHERHLEIAKEVEDRVGEGMSYCCLGKTFLSLRSFKNAKNYHDKHLAIAIEVGDKAGEGSSYGNLGNVYYGLGDYKKACEYYKRALKIAKDAGDKAEEGRIYGSLGKAYGDLEEFITASNYHHRHLKIAQQLDDKYTVAFCLYNIAHVLTQPPPFRTANISKSHGSLLLATDYCRRSVKTFNEIRAGLQSNEVLKITFRRAHADAYNLLWLLHLEEGEIVEALLAAEEGRAQALRDLMDLKYVSKSQ